jgi:hypothetical protein
MPTDIDHDDDLDDDMPTDAEPTDETPRDLRRAARDGKAARIEANTLKREVAMLKAGIDTETPIGAMFSKGYEGELTKEAVTTAWSALGVTPVAADAPADDTPEPGPDMAPGETDLTADRRALANGSASDTPVTPDPKSAAKDRVEAVISAGGTEDDAMAAGLEVQAQSQDDPVVPVGDTVTPQHDRPSRPAQQLGTRDRQGRARDAAARPVRRTDRGEGDGRQARTDRTTDPRSEEHTTHASQAHLKESQCPRVS